MARTKTSVAAAVRDAPEAACGVKRPRRGPMVAWGRRAEAALRLRLQLQLAASAAPSSAPPSAADDDAPQAALTRRDAEYSDDEDAEGRAYTPVRSALHLRVLRAERRRHPWARFLRWLVRVRGAELVANLTAEQRVVLTAPAAPAAQAVMALQLVYPLPDEARFFEPSVRLTQPGAPAVRFALYGPRGDEEGARLRAAVREAPFF